MDGIALKPLTVAFHEYGFVSGLAAEHRGADEKLYNMGPQNPQALNRYSYTLNNPVRYTDPSGHFIPSCMRNRSCPHHKLYDATKEVLRAVAMEIIDFGVSLGQTISGQSNPPPNNASVADGKIKYLLEQDKGKANAFQQLGITSENAVR